MRKFFRLLAFSVFMLCGIMARADNITIIWVNSAPSGSCTNGQPMQYVISTGVLYSCQAGTWGSFGTGSGAVTAVSVATANGVSGTSSGGSTPALTIALGAITPTSTNGVTAATMAYMDATSSVQTQLNARLPVAGGTMTGALNAPEIESTLYADQYSGSDIGAKTNAAIAASSLTVPSAVVIPPGTYNVTTPISIDRPVTLIATGAILKPQSGGASGVWGTAPVKLSSRTLTMGTKTFTVASCSGLVPAAGAQIAIGGPGIPPDDYIVSCSGTTATLVLAPSLTIYGLPTNSSSQLCGVPSVVGLANGQTLNGTGVSGRTISSIAAATNCITMSGNANATATAPQSYAVTGTVTATLTAQVVTPIISLVYNTSALRNEYYQNVGAGVRDLWLQDPAAAAGNAGVSITGVQGMQINGWDRLVVDNYEADGLDGAGLILSGFTGVSTGNPVRESFFNNLKLRSNGNWASGQSALIIGNQDNTANDQINQIGFNGAEVVSPDGINVDILSYASSGYPRLIWFAGPNGQLEKGSALANLAPLSGPGPVVDLQAVDDVYFDDMELNSVGYGSPVINLASATTVSVTHSRVLPGNTYQTYTVGITNGSPTVTLQAGYTYQFDNSGKWNGNAVWLVDGTTCTNASPCLAYISTVGSITSITLASNFTGTTNTSTATMTIGNPGVYFTQPGSAVGLLNLQGNEYNDPSAHSTPTFNPWSVFNLSSISGTNVLLTGTTWSNNYWVNSYDQNAYLGTPLNINTTTANAPINWATSIQLEYEGSNLFWIPNGDTTSLVAGVSAAPGQTSGTRETAAFGDGACNGETSGTGNVCFGLNAGYGVTTTSGNTFLGTGTGGSLAGLSNVIYIGNQATGAAANDTNEIVIGQGMTGNGSNTTTIGNTSTTKTFLQGEVTGSGHSTTQPSSGANLCGSATLSGTGWTGSSLGPYTHSSGTTALTAASCTALVAGQSYLVTYTQVAGGGGTVTPAFGGLSGSATTSSGTYTQYATATSNAVITFTPTTGFTGSVTLGAVVAQGPAATSCGTPVIARGSTDHAGKLTTAVSGCVLTFQTAYTNAPACHFEPDTAVTGDASQAVTNTSLTVTAVGMTAFDYECIGLNE